MGDADIPALSIVVTADDPEFIHELDDALGASSVRVGVELDLLVVSTKTQRPSERMRTVEVFPLESAYGRNRGLLLARAPVVAFLENGQLPTDRWTDGILSTFADEADIAAAIGAPAPARQHVTPATMPLLRVGGNVAFDRMALLAERGFPLFTGAPPGSPLPDLLVLLRLLAEGHRVVVAPTMAVTAGHEIGSRDARRVGRALRMSRQPLLGVRAASAAVRRGAARELKDLLAGSLVDDDWRFRPPEPPEPLPGVISETLGARSIVPVATRKKGKLHFLYRAGDLMLHLYVDPTEHLRDAVAAREPIRERSGAPGIPRLHATEEEVDSLWLIEDFVPGCPMEPDRLRTMVERLGDWIAALGGPPGPPLSAAPTWRVHAEELVNAGFPKPTAEALAESLRALEQVPARHLHGDLNRRNILVDGDRLAAVDWENAALDFLPGLDLVFVFLLADGVPDDELIGVLADPKRRSRSPLLPSLRKLGLDDEVLPHALRAMLATWALGERKRRARLGVDPGPALFEPLLLRSDRLFA